MLKSGLLLIILLALPWFAGCHAFDRELDSSFEKISGTPDVLFGLDQANQTQWNQWHSSMLRARASALKESKFDPSIYNDKTTSWADVGFRQYLIFMYDQSFYDPKKLVYRTPELFEELTSLYGRIDSVLLWHAYPQLGFDSRGQFDFYRQMPGGLAKLRKEVTEAFHARGVRVYVDYNPWDVSGDLENAAHRKSYLELAALVRDLDADGVMLDTMDEVPRSMKSAMDQVKRGVVFAPERRPSDVAMNTVHQSWAQWYDLGAEKPSIYRQKWLVPRHQQFAIRRWDTDRHGDIVYSFFNGSGMLLWDNVFGVWNPYSPADRKLLAETGSILTSYAKWFAYGAWAPLIPTGVSGLDANRWDVSENGFHKSIYVFRNRTNTRLSFRAPRNTNPAFQYFSFWDGAGARAEGEVVVEAGATQCLVLDEIERGKASVDSFLAASKRTDSYLPAAYEARTPEPKQIITESASLEQDANHVDAHVYAKIPGGASTMTIEHKRRESGCYPFGASENAMWGWFFEDKIIHKIRSELKTFAMKLTTVTNAEYLDFVRTAHYAPKDGQNFLKQIPRNADGSYPEKLPPSLASLPVTYVSLNDARAYAEFKHERLPSEAEWQWAAEGAGRGFKWPWGNDDKLARDSGVVNLTGKIARASSFLRGATAQGLLNMSGNTWELTESEYSDGHNRFLLLHGGVYLPQGESEWLTVRGPRENQFHAKYILMGDALDRSEAVSFRTVIDLK